jgi:hypothetical protein
MPKKLFAHFGDRFCDVPATKSKETICGPRLKAKSIRLVLRDGRSLAGGGGGRGALHVSYCFISRVFALSEKPHFGGS